MPAPQPFDDSFTTSLPQPLIKFSMRKQAQDNEHQERIAGPFRKGESVRLEHRFTEDTQGHLFRIGIIAELREQNFFTFVYVTLEIDIRFIRTKFITISGSRKLAIFTCHSTGIKLAIEVDYLRIYVVADIRTMANSLPSGNQASLYPHPQKRNADQFWPRLQKQSWEQQWLAEVFFGFLFSGISFQSSITKIGAVIID